jgi:hypothetical protein
MNSYINKFLDIGKNLAFFILSFVVIHSVFWLSSIIFYSWCVPTGFIGYFKSMISHGSVVCEVFYNIAMFAKASIRNMIVSLLAGVMTLSWGWNSFNNEVNNQRNNGIHREMNELINGRNVRNGRNNVDNEVID